jgi:succinate dehydrogenase / fumarate reductase cytochrome b subunit
MNSKNRPISPHIQIYKPQLSSFTSILHRATGIFLYIGIVAMCWAIVYNTYQVEILPYSDVRESGCDCFWFQVLKYVLYLLILGWVFSLYYHLCNGIRHLCWDIGKGYDKNLANKNAIIVLMVSTFLTAISVVYVLFTSTNLN